MNQVVKRMWRLLGMMTSASCLLSAAAPPKYEIRGVVLSSRDGTPVPFCRLSVELSPDSTPAASGLNPRPGSNPRFGGRGRPGQRTGSSGGRASQSIAREGKDEVVADEAGHFTLEVPKAGSWRLLGVAPGFHSQIFEEHQGFYTAIVLTPDTPVFQTTFRMSPDAMITGVILDEAGEAVRSAQVAAERVAPELPGESTAVTGSSTRQVEVAATDDRGHYELAGLSPGSYLVRVQAQPWYASTPGIQRSSDVAGASSTSTTDPSLDVTYPTTWFPTADSEAQAQPLVLAGGEERQADFHLNPIPAVHLQIPRQEISAAEPGRPRQQRPATITRISADGSGLFNNFTFSNGSGTGWEFSGLTPGIYEVHLPGPDGQPNGETRQIDVRAGTSGVMTLEGSTPLTRVTVDIDGVPDSDVSTVEFVDVESGRRILAMPPAGRRGRRRADEDDDAGEEEPGAGRIALLPSRSYDVVVTARTDAYLAGLDAIGAKVNGTRITLGAAAPSVHLHIARGRSTLSGFTLLADRPAEGALVLLVPITLGAAGNTQPVLRDQANSDGSFRFTAVTPGKYILLAIDHGWDVHWKDAQSLERYLLKGTALDLPPSGKLTETIEAQVP